MVEELDVIKNEMSSVKEPTNYVQHQANTCAAHSGQQGSISASMYQRQRQRQRQQ